MEIVIPMLIVLVVAAVVIPRLLRRNAREEPEAVTSRGGMPAPGEPAPHKDGRPLPGSQEDREQP